ncbi:unnamed protein product [Closterium sp. NIES-64]|nr:unnamed protein product [Closterium sp. NIES-64]
MLLCYENDPLHLTPAIDNHRYIGVMTEAARIFAHNYSADVLLLNFGPPLPDAELYSLFNKNVCEVMGGGERWLSADDDHVAVLHTCAAPTASIFLCLLLVLLSLDPPPRLAADDDHVAVLHTRSPSNAGGACFLRFVAACYLSHSSLSLPPPPIPLQSAQSFQCVECPCFPLLLILPPFLSQSPSPSTSPHFPSSPFPPPHTPPLNPPSTSAEFPSAWQALASLPQPLGQPELATWHPLPPEELGEGKGEHGGQGELGGNGALGQQREEWGEVVGGGQRGSMGQQRYCTYVDEFVKAGRGDEVGAIRTGQQQYCSYVDEFVKAGRGDEVGEPSLASLPPAAPILRKLILSACPSIDGAGVFRPYLKVFRRGAEVSSSVLPGEVRRGGGAALLPHGFSVDGALGGQLPCVGRLVPPSFPTGQRGWFPLRSTSLCGATDCASPLPHSPPSPPAYRQVPPSFPTGAAWMVPFEVNAPVWGDCAFAVHHWTGTSSRDESEPVFVFAFHSAFLRIGLTRITLHEVTPSPVPP